MTFFIFFMSERIDFTKKVNERNVIKHNKILSIPYVIKQQDIKHTFDVHLYDRL